MHLTVNGKELSFTEAHTGASLLAALKITPTAVVAEVNGKVIPQTEFDELQLASGDVLELVTVVGGG